MHTDIEKCVCVRDTNVCSVFTSCCSAPTVPVGPICLPVINSSGLTMQHFMTLFGLTNYHTPLSHSLRKNNICPWMLNLHLQFNTSIPLSLTCFAYWPLYCMHSCIRVWFVLCICISALLLFLVSSQIKFPSKRSL